MVLEHEINEEMEKVELQAVGLRPMMETAREELGERALEEILSSLGVSMERVTAPNAWMSLAFVEAFMEEMVRLSGDPAIIDRFAKLSISPKYLGFLYPLVRAFGTPEFAYEMAVRTKPRYDKTAMFRIVERGPQYISMEHRPLEGASKEKGIHFCRTREVQLAYVPMLFGMLPAETRHPKCLHRGGDACVYEMRWKASSRTADRAVGIAAGIALGAVLALMIDATGFVSGLLVALSALAGWAIGDSLKLRRELDNRTENIAEHQEALLHSMRANEERLSELMQAKAEVDEKVEKRTAELRETSQRLTEALEQMEALSRAKSDFFANVSHDLRTPLTLITGPLYDLSAGREPPGGSRVAFESMNRNARWLLRLINQLLDLSKVEAGRAELRRRSVDLISLTRSIVESFTEPAGTKGVEIGFHAPEAVGPCAVDPVWIESMLSNLLGNALRFVDRGGLIQVRVAVNDNELRMEVQDDGQGIDPEVLPHIFERFTQAGRNRKRRGGAGIGLALVREAARLHGGDVSVQSEPGKGTLFTITIPLIEAEEMRETEEPKAKDWAAARAEAEARDEKPEGEAGTPTPANGDQSRQRLFCESVDELLANPSDTNGSADRVGPSADAPLVVLVEDHADTRRYVADVLAEHYRVKAAADGWKGLYWALRLKPDAVVTDIDMPDMDGFELCRELRANEKTGAVPIILLTALDDPNNVLRGFEAGADDYVAKPFHGLELLARLRVHMRIRQMISDMAHKSRLAMLGQTAASVAHQMRNPLNAISSGLQSFQSRFAKKVDPTSRELLGMMLDCSVRIERITNDLMNLSRLDRATIDKWRAADGLSSCVRLISARLPQNVNLRDDIDNSAVVEGRPGDLNQVFLNLLDNAAKAVGEQGRIDIKAEQKTGVLQVSVADSGPGISDSDRERIFQPFITTRAPGEGTGLGLSIAKQVIEQHGGSIEVDSSPLGGALFTVRIPVAPASSFESPDR